MRMGGYIFVESDLQAEYQSTMPKTVWRLLSYARYSGLQKGWPKRDLRTLLAEMAKILEKQLHPRNKMSSDSLDRLLDF